VAMLGAGMLYFTTTSTYAELFSNGQARAYYVAEAGGRYAMKLLNDHKNDTTKYYPGGLSPAKTTYTLTLANGDKFTLSSKDHPTDDSRVIVESTGIIRDNSWLRTSRKISYNILRSNPVSAVDGTTSVAFDSNQDITLDTTWTIVVGTPSNITFDSKTNSVLIKNEKEALIAIKPAALDLAAARENSGGLLSYEVQVKVNPIIEGNKGEFLLQGLSFRYDQTRGQSYGVSFFRAIAGGKPPDEWWNKLGAGFKSNPPRDGDIYIVLWKKTSSTGNYELMNYALASTYGLSYVDNGNVRIRQFSTLLLNLTEECIPAPTSPAVCSGSRQNRIQLYVASPTNYPQGTINWNYTTGNTFSRVTWNCGATDVVDSSLTTAYWASPYPNEVGVHSFYDQPSSNDQYFADFAMRGEGFGGSGGHQY